MRASSIKRSHEGIDAKAAQLAHEIEAVRKELSDRIDANYDELVRDHFGHRARLLAYRRFGSVEPIGRRACRRCSGGPGWQLSDEMLDQLRILLKEDLDDLARRVRDVERALRTSVMSSASPE